MRNENYPLCDMFFEFFAAIRTIIVNIYQANGILACMRTGILWIFWGIFPECPVVFGIFACACNGIMRYALRENGITACACIGIMESFVRHPRVFGGITYIRRMGYIRVWGTWGILRHYDIKTPHAS